ncbi:hypothetical protein [Streptomyces sp. ST2-7A]|uniref:tetratricopeptide repeat protein n=1 Tax=Streptomyces sp. ST2-7A TaxID=2907214 RepID=UPI001F236723|nr:hypothetical protein [Streptomyces sp. ST2-7A]MCE7081850.1 hypothetical protein [Streptomyces sp. ST2-7A]
MRIFGRVRQRPSTDWRLATHRAFTLIDDGRYEDAGELLTRAADLEPWLSESWFNLALLHKFRHDWERSRAAGLRAVALLERHAGAPDWWNVGIAATALQDWPLARRAWQAYGLDVPQRQGASDEPLGMALGGAAVRLSPEGESEVVWGRRLDPARMVIRNIPLPSSGRRWGEVVLHDGVPNGERTIIGPDGHTTVHPVFDEIELWAPSSVPTWVVLLEAAEESDRDALERLAAEAGYAAEDWSSSVRLLCRACSESRMPSEQGDGLAQHDPHDHSVPGRPGPLGHTGAGMLWSPERECGLAAPASLVKGLLDGWVADSPDTREWRDLEEVC